MFKAGSGALVCRRAKPQPSPIIKDFAGAVLQNHRDCNGQETEGRREREREGERLFHLSLCMLLLHFMFIASSGDSLSYSLGVFAVICGGFNMMSRYMHAFQMISSLYRDVLALCMSAYVCVCVLAICARWTYVGFDDFPKRCKRCLACD